MTITPWTEAAKLGVRALFGDPESRAKAEEMQLKRDQFGLEQQKYGLEQQKYGLDEAYNPAKIGAAEASAGYDRARTKTEGITQQEKQIQLDEILRALNGGEAQPTAAPMSEYNPYNVGPQGQGRNPAMVLPYDQIQPLDDLPNVPAVSDQEFSNYDASPLPIGPEMIPSMADIGGDLPMAEEADPFAQLINGLTGTPTPTMVAPPNGAAYFEDLGPQPVAPAPASPLYNRDELGLMIGKITDSDGIAKARLAREAQNANQGVTDPSKRILNSAAGTGVFPSQDATLAQFLSSGRDAATMADLAENNLGTADIQNFKYSQENPGFTDYLAAKDAGQEIEFGPDGKVTRIGKGKGGGKPLTEAQGKNFTSANALEEPLLLVETMNNQGYEPNIADYTLFTQSMNSPMGASIAVPAMSAEGQRYYGAIAPVAATIANILSGQGMTDTEQQRRLLAVIPIPGEDQQARALKFRTMRSYFESADALGNPGGKPANTTAAPVQITSDADYEALAPGTTFIAPDGSQRVKP